MRLSIGRFFFVSFLFIWFEVAAQEPLEDDREQFLDVDSLYREDQFYLGFTYNILLELQDELNRRGFSGGFHIGFIRDFPLNERRNVAVGTGFGWSIDTYGHNLFIGAVAGGEGTLFEVIDDDIDYNRNRFTTQTLEVPLQFRWRTSTAETYKFWRIYTGVKLGYLYYFRSTFVQPENEVHQTAVPELNRIRAGATFSFGYNTFNFQFYYSLIPFFSNEAKLEGEVLKLRNLQVGLVFYIL